MKSFNDINEVYNFIKKSTKENNTESFIYNGKRYDYTLVSDLDITDFDKSNLTSAIRDEINILRQLKLYFELDIGNQKLICASSNISKFYLLINYISNGKKYTIDYSNNVIMNTEDYYNLFNVKEINILEKSDLYKIFCMISSSTNQKRNEKMLFLKSNEIEKMVSKNRKLRFLNNKYDSRGINMKNYFLLGDRCDSIFFISEDFDNKNENIFSEIEDFTLGHIRKNKHIYYSNEKNRYVYLCGNIRYEFRMITDMIDNEKLERILLSHKRYYHCHENSIKLAYFLEYCGINNIYVVAGKRKINNVDYLYHSWLECGNFVYDFNGNLIMKTQDYYKLYQAEAINKTHLKKIKELVDIQEDINFKFAFPFFINYFGDNLLKELKRNEFLIKK